MSSNPVRDGPRSADPEPTDFVLVAVSDLRGRLVMQERDEFAPSDPEAWNFPGGAVELGESVLEAAQRELEEETGLRADQLPELTEVARRDKWCDAHERRETFAVFVVVADLRDEDVVCREGRQMVFREPTATGSMTLTQAVVLAFPLVLTSIPYVAAHGRPPSRRFAGVLVLDRCGRLLLQERDEHAPIDPERWGMPGGHVEDGEDELTGALRELAEETGLRLRATDVEHLRTAEVYHAHYGSVDTMAVFVAKTELTDADLICGEGRQVIFVEPDRARRLDLTFSARTVIPDFLDGDIYRAMTSSHRG